MKNCGKLEKAEILEMTVQYLRALHSADFPRGREKGTSLDKSSCSSFLSCTFFFFASMKIIVTQMAPFDNVKVILIGMGDMTDTKARIEITQLSATAINRLLSKNNYQYA